ncbi:zinc finger, CCHC-type containing protein [Tanacetum coccineum]
MYYEKHLIIRIVQTDIGGEYYDPVYFQSTGIIHQTTAPYTPQQNGVAERKNRTLKEMVKGRTGSITIFGFSSLAKEDALSFLPLKVVYVLVHLVPNGPKNELRAQNRKRCSGRTTTTYAVVTLNEDASVTKFLVSNFMNYKMVDTRPVMKQYHEMLRILGQYTQHNLMMDEAISVAVILDKLPSSWKEFNHGLKHKKEESNLVQLGSHLRIEEGLRNQELDNNPKGKNQIGSSSVNMVEGDGAKNSNNNKNKRKFKSGDDKFANKKATVTCWKCKKIGHMKKDCRSRKGNDGAGSNGSKDPEKQQG